MFHRSTQTPPLTAGPCTDKELHCDSRRGATPESTSDRSPSWSSVQLEPCANRDFQSDSADGVVHLRDSTSAGSSEATKCAGSTISTTCWPTTAPKPSNIGRTLSRQGNSVGRAVYPTKATVSRCALPRSRSDRAERNVRSAKRRGGASRPLSRPARASDSLCVQGGRERRRRAVGDTPGCTSVAGRRLPACLLRWSDPEIARGLRLRERR